MPDTAINQGATRRMINDGGIVRITKGGTDYAVGFVVPGSLTINEGGLATSAEMDEHGELTGNVRYGSEQLGSVAFSIYSTKAGLTGASDVLALTKRTRDTSTGHLETFDMEFEALDASGASTGYKLPLTNCFRTGASFSQAGEGAEADTVALSISSADPDFDWATVS